MKPEDDALLTQTVDQDKREALKYKVGKTKLGG